ncbi:MAG: xanthine dehydrogenase family protein molybdopterin-binding subunit [Acidobacteria bacterium]|nr:xanthine dehydrogenase family protein molybdopterin-binding subunit [Acidobacteriota bacterium]
MNQKGKSQPIIGNSVPRGEVAAKLLGRAAYTDDIPFSHMLYGALVRSTIPHGRVRRIDSSAVEQLPGLVRVLTAKDILPHVANPYYGPAFRDRPILTMDRVRHVGEPVAVVVAESPRIARRAARQIQVDYEELPAVFNVLEAIRPEAPIIHDLVRPSGSFADLKNLVPREKSNIVFHYKLRHGNVEDGFASADRIFEDTFSTAPVSAIPLELLVSVAEAEVGGKVNIWSATQTPLFVRSEVAYVLGVPESQVRVHAPYLGGGFGNKIYIKLEVLAAVLARLLSQPVKLALELDEHVHFVTSQAAPVVSIRTGVSSAGRITARECTLYWDSGAYAEIGPRIAQKSACVAAGPYDIPNVHIDSFLVYTNNVPGEAIRGFGAPDAVWGGEVQMDMIARAMGWDPVEFRRWNLLADGKVHATGQTFHSTPLREVLDALSARVRSSGPAAKGGTGGGRRRRGSGVALGLKPVLTPTVSCAVINLAVDGSIKVYTSTVDMGQGAHTILRQMAAEALAVPVERVSVVGPDTDVTPFDHLSVGSRSTFYMGNAVLRAAEQIRRQLISHVSKEWGVPCEALDLSGGSVVHKERPGRAIPYTEVIQQIYHMPAGSLIGQGGYVPEYKSPDPNTGQSESVAVFWFAGGNAVDIEVDPDTGKLRIMKLVTVGEVGKAINPASVRTQLSGAAIMRLGHSLFEACRFDGGQMINNTLSDYKVPTFLDLPEVMETEYIEVEHPEGPFGAKGVGETGTFGLAPAIANAVYDAVGVWVKDLPLTPEKVLRAIKDAERRDQGESSASVSPAGRAGVATE